MYNSLEITSGLTMDDLIAFPYGRDVKEAMKGHILASASTVGTYTLNPKLLKNS